jgi:thioredoxin 2
MVSPALEQVARELAGKLKLVKVNVDEAPKLSERFSVQAVPTLATCPRLSFVIDEVSESGAQDYVKWGCVRITVLRVSPP